MKLNLTACAKINLTLDVLRKRNDGYHEIKMIMQTINLKDQLLFTKMGEGIKIEVNNPNLPTGKENLVYQAAKLLFAEFNLNSGLKVKINKKIPVAAGLGGGSANAAATLVAVNKLWKLGLSNKELIKLGAKLGADVPFFIKGGTQLATGIGTELKVLPSIPKLNLVVINPPLKVSTAEVYKNFSYFNEEDLQTDKMLSILPTNNNQEIINRLGNNLSKATKDLYPQILELKKRVGKLTAKTLISGSGPTVLGFVDSKKRANEVAVQLKHKLGPGYKIEVAETIKQGIEECD